MKNSGRKDAYAKAGVNIDAGNELVRRIKPLAAATARPGAQAALGGFGAFFDIKACGYKDPLIVSTNDGVGTKLKIAIETGRHDTIGIDCVAMCVNDLVVSGAEPLFFLDYFASGTLDVGVAEKVIAGIAHGCKESNCALVGGETAELPGLYAKGDYDVAGFAVGAVERDGVITGEKIKEGDVVMGLAASGAHSNGYSLIRKIIADKGLSYAAPAPFAPGMDLAEAFLIPTKLYVRPILTLCKEVEVKGMAHITGGGLLENIPRVLPKGLGVTVDGAGWRPPAMFQWLAREGNVTPEDMIRTFNCGIGMAVVIDGNEIGTMEDEMESFGIACSEIGIVEKRVEGQDIMRFVNMGPVWPS
ncbi:MAG TPA: phosphoribosylformylglycinamidine cyclo-ligase [Alphaproteobacteria bacterium]|nr:phosphoribosylformylglycinamidine cyclo-ligase [Alphaproteobacteria bacterium]